MQLSRLGPALALMGLLGAPAWCQDNSTPVAVISLVWGQVTVKHEQADYKPARWLEPIYPGDFVKTSGAGSKLLITFFNDNHQEVVGTDIEATVAPEALKPLKGGKVRRDGARNPFGAGGVDNPFVYTRKLVADDFKGADAPGLYEAEEAYLKAAVNSSFPPSFAWPAQSGAQSYHLQVKAPSLQFSWAKTVAGTRYKMSQDEANAISKGATYQWQVSAGSTPVVAAYPFKSLTLPLEKWLKEQRNDFNGKRSKKQLQRSDYTDYLLVCSQLTRMDEAITLCQEMAAMDANNPRVFRALTRVYLGKGCPAHAKKAHETQLQLGGYDPIGL
ncbi:hypothetical protein IV102_23280 [bacterium]|nr:hypothetical protein [bacterium]